MKCDRHWSDLIMLSWAMVSIGLVGAEFMEEAARSYYFGVCNIMLEFDLRIPLIDPRGVHML
jgi:hypothetical protein